MKYNLNFKTLIIAASLILLPTLAVAGTILLMGIGLGTPGGVTPGCTDKLDFSQVCNSQYITAIGF